MAVSSAGYHEPLEQISEQTRDLHRALVSLQEELEAVDWYRQRADACADPALKEILLHNMREEIEHACMVLEWLRRSHPDFERHLKTYLFTEAPITEVEEVDTGKSSAVPMGLRLTIGSLKQREGQ
ncbi:ferritin-like domain-containing protein [Pelomicrobium sp.]|jgi:ferritin-like protein|uniref:ferritin-like domain-containing protein n=1 Tax=Pelomicrobium sp. TaxID=2815319 RepID=UPI002FDDD279